MSFDRKPETRPSFLPPQYATATDDPSDSRSFNTMPSPSSDHTLLHRIQVQSTHFPKAWISPICGVGAGFASGIVTCPLDVIKTKLQAQGGFNRQRQGGYHKSNQVYRGILGTGRTIFREEGMRGLYRGLGPMLLGLLPTWAVYLTVYENTRQYYYDKCGSWWVARCYSSLTAGACSTTLTNPIWVIKTRLQSQSAMTASDGMRAPWHYTSTRDAIRKMYQAEGLRAFYSGLTPALLGLTHVAVQFPLYEYFKLKFTGFGIGEHPSDGGSTHWMGISAATFLSKTCASTATYPHEVLRTRLQTQQKRVGPAAGLASSDGMRVKARYDGVFKTCRVILQEEGWRAFYAGLGVNLVRAIPSAMTVMLTYEWLQNQIHQSQAEGEKLLAPRDGYAQ